MKILDAHTRTMGKTSRIKADPGSLASGLDTEAYEVAQVAALKPLLEAMLPSDQVITRILSTGSAKALELLFAVHSPAAYHPFVDRPHSDSVSLGGIIKAGNVEALRILKNAGFAIEVHAHKMLVQAVRCPTDAYLSFVRGEVGYQGRILDCVSNFNVLVTPPDYALAELEVELCDILAGQNNEIIGPLAALYYRPQNFNSLRISAICLWGIADLGTLVGDTSHTSEIPALQHLASMTLSNHGRLALKAMEPSLADILARPKTAPFYGLTTSDLKSTQSA
jgi:hypothetical protein